MRKTLLFVVLATLSANISFSQCLDWVDPTPTTGWNDFGEAPCDGNSVLIDAFQVYKSEAYQFTNTVAGGVYTFSHCTGPGAGSWTPEYTVIAPSGAVDAFGAGDGDGCSITWTASEDGLYIVVINEADNCGVAEAADNGYPQIENVSGGAACCSYPVIVNNGFDCTNSEWSVILNFSDLPDGVTYTLSNSFDETTVSVDAAGDATSGPFPSGEAVDFFLTDANEDACVLELGTLQGDCTEPCETFANPTPYAVLVDAGIPQPDENGQCDFVEFSGFEIWGSEMYALDGLAANTNYIFSACNGPGAGSYPISYTVFDDGGAIVTSGTDADGCSISFQSGTGGDYVVGITAIGLCGSAFNVDNGFPAITCDGLVSTQNFETIDAQVYPNPTRDVLNIIAPFQGAASVTVFDVLGKQVAQRNLNFNLNNVELNVSNLENGTYIIQITSNEKIATSRFVKQ